MKVIVCGDFCDRYRVSEAIKDKQFDQLFSDIRPIINSADFSIVNFEFPIVLSNGKPILKCGPNLSGQIESVEAIKYAGIKCCTLANNHILDQGTECGEDTKRLIQNSGIDTVGFGSNLTDAATVLYRRIDGFVLAIINCCEHEFSIASSDSPGANPLNPIQQYHQIQQAKSIADAILVITHGGHEHYSLPSPRMKELFHFFVDSGADAVINHHQHCYSGIEVYNGKPICYGLGNFLFDEPSKRHCKWNYGYMISLDFKKGRNPIYELYPYNQCDDACTISLLKGSDNKDFTNTVSQLSRIIEDDEQLVQQYKEWIQECTPLYDYLFTPWKRRFFRRIYRRGFLPSLRSRKQLLLFKNFIECESHHERMVSVLDKLIDG